MNKNLLHLFSFFSLLWLPALASGQCNFSPSSNLVCGGELVDFTVISPAGGSIYSWDFNNDGNIDNFGTMVSFPFPTDIINRTFTVTLYRDGAFCSSQNIQVRFTPDASIAVVPGSGIMDGNEMRVCNADSTAELSIYNASLTYTNNTQYEIDWGDGTVETYTNATFPNTSFISHNYSGEGYYNVRVTVTGTNGCVGVETYVFYNGSNPSVGLASPGNTVGLCVPATIRFPIINTELNPDGTVYVIRIGGDTVGVYTQANIPDTLVYTFLESSCGTATSTGNYQNAFDVQVLATNPCGSSNAIIEPIEISEPPEINFDVDRPLTGCASEPFTFTNSSVGIQEVISGNCSTNLTGSWTITPGVPGVHWNILAGNPFGSDILVVEWLIPGDYTVKMNISSPSCGEFEIERGVTIIDEATAGATATLINASSPALSDICAPTLGLFQNTSIGDSLSYTWNISPNTGWLYANGTNDTTSNLDVIFTDAGSYNVSLTAFNQCSADTWDTTLVIAGDPAIILDPIPDVCESTVLNFNAGNVLFHANGGTFQSFIWSFPGATPSTSTDQYPTGITYDSPGNYTVMVTVANECGSYTTSTDFYIQQPGNLIIDPDMEVCRDSTPFQLNANLLGGLWSGNGVSGSGLFNPSTAQIGVNQVIYTYQDSLCTLRDTMNITVHPLPMLTAGPDQEACVSDGNFLILGYSPVGGTWTSDNGGVIVGANAFNPSASGDGVFTLTYTYTDGNGCRAQVNKTVIIHPLPSVEAGPDRTVCDNPTDVPMSGFSPAGGVWSGVGVTPTGIFNVNNTPGVGQYVLYYTFTNMVSGCTNTDSLQVTVVPPTSAVAGADEEVCINDNPYVITTGSPVGGYWTGAGVDSTSNVFDPAAAGVGVHVLTYTFGGGNCQDQDTKLITVRDIPTITIMSDREECIDFGTINLVASPGGGNWTGIGVSGTQFDPVVAGAGTFTLTYTYTDATTNCSNSASVDITINPLPVVNTQDTTYCNTPGLVDLPLATPMGGNWSGPGVVGTQFDPAQAGGEGSYTLTYAFTDGEGCSDSETITVQVISPDVVNAGPDRILCADDAAINLAVMASPSGGIWSANGSNGLSGGQFDPVIAGVGVHTLTYTVGSGNCQVTDDITVDVKALPIVEAGGNFALCESEPPFALAGFSPPGGTWSGSGLSDVVNGIFDPGSVAPGDHVLTYTYTDAFGCSDSDTKTITVYPLPNLTVRDTSYCNTPGLVDLPVTNPAGGTWSGSGVLGSQFDPSAAGGVGTYILTYSYTDGNSCSSSTTINVTVISPESVSAGPDRIVCVDLDLIDLSVSSSPVGGVWSANGSRGLVGRAFYPGQAGVGVHTLTYSVGSGNCLVSDDLIIEVKPLPVVEAGQDVELCINEGNYQLTGFSPLGGVWSGTGVVDVVNGIFDPASVAPGDYELTYSFTDIYGCESEDSRTITVHPLPVISAMADTAFCNTPGLVNLPQPTPVGGTWSGPGVLGSQFDPQTAGGVGVYTLTYSYTDNNGCNNTEDMRVTIVSPEDVEAGPNRLVCIDHGVIDLGVSASPLGGSWSANGSGGLSGDQFDPMAAGAGIHVLTYSVGADNCRVTDNVVVEVKPLPVVEAGGRVEICINEDPITLNGYSPGGGVWSGSGLIDVVNGIFDPASVAPGEYELTYTFTDFFGCVNFDTRTVEVKPLPVVDAGPDTTFCDAPLNVYLTPATPIGGNWSGPGIVNPTNGTFNPETAGGEGIYTLTYTYTDISTGCTDQDQIFVTVVAPQIIEAGPNDTVCIDQGLYQLPGFTTSLDGTWSGPGIVDASQGIFDPQVAQAGIHILTYSYGVGSCLVEDSKTILVVDLSYVLAGPPENSCLTYPAFELSGESPPGGVWGGRGILNSSTGLFDPGQAGVGTHTIDYTFTDPMSGCQYTTTKEVTVFPMVEPDFIMPEVACRGIPVVFENLTPSTYRFWWSFGDGRTSSAFEPVHTYYNDGDYTVRLIVENDYGCRDTVEHSLIITDRPVAFFEPETNLACEGIELDLTNESYGYGLSYLWDFGNGRTSTEANPGIVYFGQGINDTSYVITLEVTNLCGTSVFQDVITVRPTPKPDIGISSESDCSPITINFANTTVGAAAGFYWDFGNGETSTDAIPPPQIYTTDSTTTIYDVMLIAFNECGTDTAFTQVVVEPADVRAFFEPSALLGCQPLTIDFSNFSTPGANIDWDFGDGNTSADDNPTHTFEEAGTFTVVQYASSDCGYDTTALQIRVLPQPDVFFTHETRVCIGQEVSFNNQSQNVSGNLWDFGDGDSSSLNNPVHTYYVPGTYTVTLSGISQFNQCPATHTSEVTVLELPHAEFEPSAVVGCVPMNVEFADLSRGADFYIWDFGDGNTGAGPAPNHVFDSIGSYSVSLVVGDANGCYNDTTLLNILVNPVPTAEFAFDQISQCQLPAQIDFENLSEDAIGYSWTFGDGEESTFNEPSHIYTESGTYPVELVAVNQYNCTDTSTLDVRIFPEPSAEFALIDTEGCAPLTATFANRSTGSNSYYWDFGDGASSTEEVPTHVYNEEGDYDVKLVVSIDDVCFDSTTLFGAVRVHPQPIASFEAVEASGLDQNSGTYQFLNRSQYADYYFWEFDDGTTSEDESPIHRFMHNGNQQIYLEVSNDFGCVDDTIMTIVPPCIKGLHLPNGFSPEHGIGDVRLFKPSGIGLKEFHVQVYSPYGQLLWESRELDSDGMPSEAWDGTHNGQLLPQDVYVWRATGIFCDGTVWQGVKGEEGVYKTMGSVILLR